MVEDRNCPQCQAELPADSPEGVCPKCLLRIGLDSQQDSQPGLQREEAMPQGSRFLPPQPEELAKHFPQLEILELVGSGGMGAVYKARQPGLDRLVALKILPPEVGQDPAFAERFTREARALAKLSHPNIVAIHDCGRAGPFYYLVMEYVDGVNLRETLQAGHLQPPQALAIVPQICDALQFAHEAGIVHRDVKPENLLLDKKGQVKIADFGLAKLLGRIPADFTLTGTQQVMGTPHYMAPEQMEKPLAVDHRADIYSLGVVFYEMLTGELPIGRFAAPSQKVQVDVRLDQVVLKTLEREVERRYQHVSDVKTDVESISSGPETGRSRQGDEAAITDQLVLRRLRIPARGLLVAGILDCLFLPLLAALSIPLTALAEEYGIGLPGAAEAMLLLPSLAVGMTLIVGAAALLRRRSYGLAMAASIVALIPCTVGWLISLPFGIWALVVLSTSNAEAAFRAKNAGARSLHDQ